MDIMTSIKTIFSAAALLLGASLLSSCEGDNTLVSPKDKGKGTEGNFSVDTDYSKTPSLEGYTVLKYGFAEYYGDYAWNGTSNILFTFSSEEIDEEMTEAGSIVQLDVYASGETSDIVTGYYQAASTFVAGSFSTTQTFTYDEVIDGYMDFYDLTYSEVLEYLELEEGEFVGSDICDVEGTCVFDFDNEELIIVTDGAVGIYFDGSRYTVRWSSPTETRSTSTRTRAKSSSTTTATTSISRCREGRV